LCPWGEGIANFLGFRLGWLGWLEGLGIPKKTLFFGGVGLELGTTCFFWFVLEFCGFVDLQEM